MVHHASSKIIRRQKVRKTLLYIKCESNYTEGFYIGKKKINSGEEEIP